MTQTIKLAYGATQPLLSSKMQSFPNISKWVNNLFGATNIGNYARSRVFRKQILQLPLQDMTSVLDLGCGYGEYSFMMAKGLKYARVTALDIDPDALHNVKFAQSKLQLKNLDIYDGYLNTLPKSNVDLIYSVDVFEHIEKDAMPFADAFDRLKTGGYLMVKMPHVTQTSVFPASWFKAHEEWLKHEHPGQVYSLNDLKQRFEKEGFTITFAERTDGKISRLAWELAYLMKKGGPLLQLISLPICKALVAVDMLRPKQNAKHGNAITVIGQKN